MRLKPYARRVGIVALALLLLPAASFAAETRTCVSFAQMDDLALVNDETILVTMKGNVRKRVDLQQCAGLAKSSEFSYTSTATALCESAALPVTQAPASCTIRRIVDIDAAAAAALLAPPTTDAARAQAAAYAQVVKEAAQRKADQERKRTAVAFDPKAFDKFLGSYQIDLDIFVTVTRKDARYYYRVTGDLTVEVFPESATKFFAKSVPAQISFAPRAQGTENDLTLHRNGDLIPARRVDDAVARASEAALGRRIGALEPDAEREALLRRYLLGEQKGQIPAEILSPALLAYTTQQWPAIQETNQRLGQLEVLKFVGFHQDGSDKYQAHYEHGSMIWVVGSLTTDRKLLALSSVKAREDCPARCGCSETTVSVKDTWKPIALIDVGDEIQLNIERKWASSAVDAPPQAIGARQTGDPETWAKVGQALGGGGGDAVDAAVAMTAPVILIDLAALEPGALFGPDALLGKIGTAPHFVIYAGKDHEPSYATGTTFSRVAERSGPLMISKNNSGQMLTSEDKLDVKVRVCSRGNVTILPTEVVPAR